MTRSKKNTTGKPTTATQLSPMMTVAEVAELLGFGQNFVYGGQKCSLCTQVATLKNELSSMFSKGRKSRPYTSTLFRVVAFPTFPFSLYSGEGCLVSGDAHTIIPSYFTTQIDMLKSGETIIKSKIRRDVCWLILNAAL